MGKSKKVKALKKACDKACDKTKKAKKKYKKELKEALKKVEPYFIAYKKAKKKSKSACSLVAKGERAGSKVKVAAKKKTKSKKKTKEVSARIAVVVQPPKVKAKSVEPKEAKATAPKKTSVTSKTTKEFIAKRQEVQKITEIAKQSMPHIAPKNGGAEDDLKKVEGIGPKIEQLLKAAKIKTYADLAAASVERLEEILLAAGSRYRMHKPGTWPQQSALCRDGKWEELKKWQSELKGGR